MATLFRAGLLIPPLLSSRLSESASDAVFDLIDALNSAIYFVPRIFRDPVHFLSATYWIHSNYWDLSLSGTRSSGWMWISLL